MVTIRTKILFLLLGIGVFTYLVLDFGIENILLNLERTGWWFAPIIAVWGIVYWMNARAWHSILRDHTRDVGFGTILQLTIAGFAINYITPFLNLGGEPYRVLALREKVGLHRAASSVILYNMVRILAHCLFWLGAILLLFFTTPVSLPLFAGLALAFMAIFLVVLFFFARHRKGIFASLLGWLPGIPLLRRVSVKLETRRDTLLTIDKQITQLYREHRPSFYKALVYEIASRVVASAEFYFILKAIGGAASVVDAIFINAASSLILNILFFVPFELGAREGGLYVIMASIGYSYGIGVFVGLVNRVRELFWILVGLILMAFSGGRRESVGLSEILRIESRI